MQFRKWVAPPGLGFFHAMPPGASAPGYTRTHLPGLPNMADSKLRNFKGRALSSSRLSAASLRQHLRVPTDGDFGAALIRPYLLRVVIYVVSDSST